MSKVEEEIRKIGHKDVHGVDIREGDTVRLWCNSTTTELGTAKGEWICVVVYDTKKAAYRMVYQHLSWGFDDTDFNGYPYYKEVIKPQAETITMSRVPVKIQVNLNVGVAHTTDGEVFDEYIHIKEYDLLQEEMQKKDATIKELKTEMERLEAENAVLQTENNGLHNELETGKMGDVITEQEQTIKELRRIVTANRHYFQASPDNKMFCVCGEYITSDVHVKYHNHE